MPKVKRQSVREVQDKAYWARLYAQSNDYQGSTIDTAMNLNRGKARGLDRLLGRTPIKGERSAARMMQKTKSAELDRSAARAQSVTKRAKAKAEKAKTTRALTGMSKKSAPKAKKR